MKKTEEREGDKERAEGRETRTTRGHGKVEGERAREKRRDHLHQSRGKAKTVFCTVIIIEE
jgi:hypothetical protein